MEGWTPAYYTDASQTTVYRSGYIALSNSCVNWNSGYRLPTEAEWEKAARGGLSVHRFPWGDTISESQANYYSCSNCYTYDLSNTGYNPTFNDGFLPYTSPVDYFTPNGYGLYDMAGNVWQWCWDWYDGSWYSNTGATQNDTRGPPSSPNGRRVLRGGSWIHQADVTRCGCRDFSFASYEFYPDSSYNIIGFRCVLPHSGQPVITVQPQNRVVTQGDNVTFSVTAIGDAPLYYQWQENGTDIVSATGTSLTLSTTNFQTGSYYISVVVANGVGIVTSRSALLKVTSSGEGEF
jgi:hypothetical protein